MPLPLEGHTILEIGDNSFILIGGSSPSGYSAKTFYINGDNKKWTPGPNLTEARYLHTSGLLTDQITQKKSVVIFGGQKDFKILNSVEMLSLPIEDNKWEKGN